MIDGNTSVLWQWKGLRIIAISLGGGLIGVLPLLLYVALGPKNGNPVGLGLLAVVTVAIAIIGVLAGAIWVLVEFFLRQRH